MSEKQQRPKIACLPNGPYYLLHDMTPVPVPNLCRANGERALPLVDETFGDLLKVDLHAAQLDEQQSQAQSTRRYS